MFLFGFLWHIDCNFKDRSLAWQESFSLASSCNYSEFNESQVRRKNDSSTSGSSDFFDCPYLLRFGQQHAVQGADGHAHDIVEITVN
ncbi:hypothetical protein EFT54_05595 [Lacticaseibacillus paracasei]|nr:hypothetical protein [Lacticaseibacillus paracasei]